MIKRRFLSEYFYDFRIRFSKSFLLTVILIKIESYEFRVKKGENYVM